MRNSFILTLSSAVLCTVSIFAADDISPAPTRPQVKPPAPQSGQAFRGGVIINNSGGNPGAALARAGGKSPSEWYIESVNKVVPLTPDQQNTMMKIIEARDKAVQEFNAKNADKMKAAQQAMGDAFKSQDKDAIAKAQKEYQGVFAGTSEIYRKSQKELDDVLTPEQMAKRKDAQVAQVIKSLTDGVTLTAEQETKIKAVVAEAGGGEGRERANYQAVQDVLTAGQKAAITKNRTLSMTKMMFGRANLTADQLKAIETAYDDIVKSGNAKPGEIPQKLHDAVNNLLTPEQKEAKIADFQERAPRGAAGTTPLGAPQILNPAPRP